jgi:hypothetical protein
MEENLSSPVETTEVVEQPVQEVQQQQPMSDKEYNMRQLRERAERAERELEQARRSQQPQPSEEDDLGVEDDALLEGKQLKKYHKQHKGNQQKTQAQLDQITTALAALQLRTDHPDINTIVTDENLEKLARVKPHIYRSIMANPDFVDRGKVAHDAISTWVKPDKHIEQDRRLEENKAKPRTSSSVGPQQSETPLTRVGDYDRRILSNADKDRIMREVQLAKSYR